MTYLIKKRNKFMKGHGYATGFGYNFSWTDNEATARRFLSKEGAEELAQASKSKLVVVPSTKKELKQIGKMNRKEI